MRLRQRHLETPGCCETVATRVSPERQSLKSSSIQAMLLTWRDTRLRDTRETRHPHCVTSLGPRLVATCPALLSCSPSVDTQCHATLRSCHVGVYESPASETSPQSTSLTISNPMGKIHLKPPDSNSPSKILFRDTHEAIPVGPLSWLSSSPWHFVTVQWHVHATSTP